MLKKMIITAVLFTVLLSSCGSGAGETAMSLEYNGKKTEFSANIYSYYLSLTKTQQLMSMFVAAGITSAESMYDMPEIWDDDEISAEIKAQAELVLKQMIAIAAYCKDNSLELPKDQINDIDLYIREVTTGIFGSKANLNNTLARFGINEKIYKDIKQYERILGVMNVYLFNAETGKRPVPYEDIVTLYEANFSRFKHILITTTSSELDVEGNPVEFTEEELTERRQKANDIYNRILDDGEDFEKLIESDSEDSLKLQLPDGYTVSKATTIFPENLVNDAIEMKIGDVRLIETDAGLHIVKKYELMPPEQTLDITSSSSDSIASTINRLFQMNILAEEIAPYMEKIVMNTEETDKFTVKASDVMFDCLEWITG